MEREDIIDLAVKAVIYIVACAVVFTLIMGIPSCGGTKYCKVDGCPSEASLHSPYCYGHKCNNTNCDNLAYVRGYCKECLERAAK